MSLVRLQAAKMGRTRPSMKSDSGVINVHAPYGFNMKLFSSICILSCLLSLVPPVAARGRLMEPVQRSSLWRRGFDAPVNNDDSGLNCGGSWRQNEQNSGRCGGCGDPYDAVPRDNEPGGVYANGIISNTYTTNDSSILVVIDVQNFLKGYFEFRICAVNDPLRPATQDCLDHHVLRMWDYDAPEPRYRYWPAGAGLQKLRVELPRGLVCQQCVLQWKWHTGLDWGRCEDGLYALGCGPQEEYYNCADIAIVNHAPGGGVDSVQPPLPVVGPAHHQLDNSATYEIGFGSRDISQASASNAQMSSNINRNTRVGIPISFMSNDPLTGQAIEPVQPRFDFFDFVKTTAAPTIHRSTMETVPVKSDTKEISTKQKKTEVVLPFNGDSRAPLPVINNNELQFGSNNELTYDLKPTALPTGSSPDSRIRVSPSVADTLMPGRVIFPSISGISTGNRVSTNQASPSTVTKVSNKRPEMKPMSTIVSNKRTTTFQVPTRNGIPISIFPTAITSFNTEQTPSGTTSHVNPTELPTSLSPDSMPAIVSPTSASHMMFPGVSVNAHFIIDSVSQTHTSPTGPASSAIPTTGQPAVRRKRQAMPSMSPPPPPPTEQSASTATIEFVGGSFGGAAVENMMFGSPSTGPADIGRYPVPSIQPVDRQTGRDPLATEALGEPIVETRVVSTSSTSGVSNSITGSASFGRFDPMSVVALQSTRHAVGASNAVPGQDISLTAQSDITTPDPNAVPYEPPRIPRPPQLTRAEMKASIATDPVISSSISDTGKKTDASFLIGSEYIEGLNEGPSNQAETSTAAKHGTMIIHVDTSGSSSRGSAMGNAIVEYLSPTGATSIADKPKDTVADTRMTHSSIRFQPTAEQLLSQAGSRLPMTLDTTNLEPTGPAPVDPVELQKQALIRQLGEAMGIIPHTPDANFVQMPANTMQSHNPSLSAMLSYMQPGQQQSSGGISQEGRQAQMMDAMSANMNQPGEAMGMIPHTPDPNLVQMPPNTMQSPDPSLSAMLSYMQADQQRSSGGISPKGSQPQMMGAMSSNMNQPGEAMGMIPHTPDTNLVQMPHKSMQSPGPTLSDMLSYMQASQQQSSGGISPEGIQAQMMGAMSSNMNQPGEAMGMIPHTPDANFVKMPPKSMQSPGPTLSAMLSYMQAGKKQGNDGISPEGSQAQMMGAMSSNMNEPGEAMGMIPHTPDANLVQMPPKSVQSPDPTLSAMLSYTQTGQQRSSGGISHVGSQAQMTGAMSGNMNQQLLESTKLRSVPHVNVGQKEMPLTQTPVGMPPLTGTRNVRLTDATGSSLTPMEQQAILRQQQSNMEYLMSSLGARFGQNQQQIQNMMLNKYAMMLGGNAEKVSPPRTSVNLAPDSTATATTTTQNSEAIMFPGSATGTEIPSQIKSSQSEIQSRIDTSVGVAQKQITNGEIQSRISTTVSISPTDHTKADLTVAGQQVNTGVNTEAARSKRPVDLTSQQQMHGDMFQTQGNMAMLPSVKPDVVPSDGVTLVVGAKNRATLETAASGSTGGQVMEASSQTTMEQIDPMQLQSNIQATQFTDSTVSQAAGQTPTETAVNTNVYDASAGDMHSASQVGDTPSTFTGAAAASSFTPLGTQGSASQFSWTLTGSSGTNTDTQQWGWDPALQQWVLVDNTLAPSKQDTQFVSTATTGSIATPTGTGNTGTYQTAKVQSRETVITAISDQTAADMPIIPVSPSKLPDIAAPQVDQKATSEVKTSGTSISTIKAVDTKVPTETVSFGNVMTKGQADITAQQVPTVDSGAADAFMWQNVEYVWDPATNAYVPIFSPTYADSAVGQQDPVAPGPDVATSNQLAQTQTHTAHVSFKSELPQQGPKYTAAGAVDTKPIPAVQPEQQQPVLDIQAQYPQQTLAVQTTEQHMVDGQPKQAIDAPQRQNQQVFDSQVQALDAKTQKMSQVSFEPQPPQQQHAFDVASQTSQQDLHVGQQSTVITQQTQPIVGTVHVAPQQTQHHMNIQTTHQVLETQPAQIANTAQIQFVQTDISSQGLKHKRTPLLTYPTEQQQLQGSGVGRNLPLLATESGAAGPGPHVVAPQSSTGRSGGTVAQSMAQVSQETTQQIESQKVQTMEQPAGRASDTPSSRSQQSSQSYPPVDTIFAPISQSSGAMESHAASSTGSTVSETFTPIGQSGSVVDSITPVGHTGSSSADVATSIAWDAILKAAQAHAAHKTDAAQIPAAAPLDSTAQTTAGQVDPTAYDAFGWPVVPEPVQQIPVPEPQQHIQHSPAIQHQQLQNIPPAQMTSMQISSNTQTAVQPMQLTPIVQTQQQTQLGSQVQSGSSTNTNQQEILHDIFLQWQKTQLAQGQHASIGYLPYPQTQGMGVLQVPAGNVVPATSQILPSQAVQQAQTQAAAQVGLQWQQNQHQQQQQQQQQQLTHNLQNTLARVLAAQAAGQAVAQPAGQSTDQLLTVVPVWMAEMIRNGAINQLSAQPKPQPQPPKPKPAPMPKPPKRKVPIRPDPETRNMVRDMFMQQMRPGTDPLQILVGLTPELLMKSGVNPRIANSGDAFQIIPAVERALGIRIRSRRPGGRAGGPPGANNMGGMDAGPPGGIGGPRGRMSPRARALARRQFMQQQKLQTEMMQMLGLGPEPLEPGDPGYRGPPGGATSMIPGVAPGMEPTDAQAAAHAARQARGGGTSSMGSMGGMGAMSGLGAMGGMGGMGAMAGMGSTAGGRGGRSRQQQMSAMMEMIGM